MGNKPPLRLLLANPRGFCAGVVRAIELVEHALQHYPKPVYVRHAIVHNPYVVRAFEKQGVTFVEEIDEVPDGATLLFSAHGVAKSVEQQADRRHLTVIDATCPLVKKVHGEAAWLQRNNYHVIVIGHPEHVEVQGILGQLDARNVSVVENIEQASKLTVKCDKVGYVTQTTLSVDDTASIIEKLKHHYPNIKAPNKDDICYATSNRQAVVKTIASLSDKLWVIGSETSSNTLRLLDTARHHGCEDVELIQSTADVCLDGLSKHCHTLGITASASAPEFLVQDIIHVCQQSFTVDIREITYIKESTNFKIPALPGTAAAHITREF